MEEECLLVCKNVEVLTPDEAALTGSKKWDCERCGAEVWIVPRNLLLKVEKKAVVICLRCAVELHNETDVPTKLQWAKPAVDELENKKK